MVDSIGARPVSSETRVARVSAPKPPAAVATSSAPARNTTALSGVARSLAGSPPVDVDRVAMVRRAIERGDFPILPATIADQMIALKYDWMNTDEQA